MTTKQKEQKKTSKHQKIDKITKRSDYLRASKSKYFRSNSFIIQFYNRVDDLEPRYGVTATKKIGNAIKRNKAKRRIRNLVKDLLPKYGKNGYDYVFIAKENLIDEDWEVLKEESTSVLKDLKYE
ncbi:MAG: ribonuclease P protein component [Alphaproteobacteria bacterium]|jgi:ribonuclease P protein component|tara:strand:+ start:148 stop:522 length:375 start_codon:yes stop_codon:yes gene_type:complete